MPGRRFFGFQDDVRRRLRLGVDAARPRRRRHGRAVPGHRQADLRHRRVRRHEMEVGRELVEHPGPRPPVPGHVRVRQRRRRAFRRRASVLPRRIQGHRHPELRQARADRRGRGGRREPRPCRPRGRLWLDRRRVLHPCQLRLGRKRRRLVRSARHRGLHDHRPNRLQRLPRADRFGLFRTGPGRLGRAGRRGVRRPQARFLDGGNRDERRERHLRVRRRGGFLSRDGGEGRRLRDDRRRSRHDDWRFPRSRRDGQLLPGLLCHDRQQLRQRHRFNGHGGHARAGLRPRRMHLLPDDERDDLLLRSVRDDPLHDRRLGADGNEPRLFGADSRRGRRHDQGPRVRRREEPEPRTTPRRARRRATTSPTRSRSPDKAARA